MRSISCGVAFLNRTRKIDGAHIVLSPDWDEKGGSQMTEPDRDTAEEPTPDQTDDEDVELHGGGKKGGGLGGGATLPVEPPAPE